MDNKPKLNSTDRLLRFLHKPFDEKIRTIINRTQTWRQRIDPAFRKDLSFTEMIARFPERDATYSYALYYYEHHLPARLREHRTYFKENRRGFGEDAFHAMWWLLQREYQLEQCLEIGVYRGQVISLWALITQMLKYPCTVHGISPFSSLGDSVSVYRNDVNYMTDTLDSFRHFNLPAPTLVKALSTNPEAINHIAGRSWNLIYIDGCHDYEIALADYRVCREHLVTGGLLVMDDASLGTSYQPPSFAFAGHPGPSRVAAEYAMRELRFLGAVGHNNVFQKTA